VAGDLLARGFAQCDDFLDADSVLALRRCLNERKRRGEFRAAGIGPSGDLRFRPDLRGDVICWLEQPLVAVEARLLQDLERLRSEINAAGLLGLWDVEAHYAWYAPGSAYARHIDRPLGSHRRTVSFVLYLNPSWREGDGGEFRSYRGERVTNTVLPLGGRFICFLSAQCEHEVLAARHERASLTGWFSTRA
jgi:SM-20-related protein